MIKNLNLSSVLTYPHGTLFTCVRQKGSRFLLIDNGESAPVLLWLAKDILPEPIGVEWLGESFEIVNEKFIWKCLIE